MRIRSKGLWGVMVLAAAAALALATSCNSGSAGPGATSANTQLIGAGSTFVTPIMTRWISDFSKSHPTGQINYQSIGSGGGIQQLKKGLVDFGASDAALSDEQLKEMPPLVQVPESAGPVCITYNLPGLQEPLQLSGPTLAGIYLGTIKNWRDPAVKKDNPKATLPNDAIVVVHRSDGSGTTNIFTTYLSAVSPQWQQQVGRAISVKWPVGLGGKGSEGVTEVVKQTAGAIGYVELNYAEENHLPVVLMRNQAGNWVKPTADSATAAIAAFQDQLSKDVRTPIVDAPASAPDAYPITGLTFLLIPKDGSDQAKRAELKQFVSFVLGPGQQYANDLHYASLSSSLVQIDQSLLGQLQANGQPLP